MKKKTVCYEVKVQPEEEGLRLDQLLGQKDFIKNRSQALKVISDDGVLCDGKFLKASYKVSLNDLLKISLEQVEEIGLVPYKIPLDIVYKDKSILVINKPSGLVVHPAPGHSQDTLVNALYYHKLISRKPGSLRPGIVHRLDKDASGLMVLARTEAAETVLVQQFKERTVKRIYWALSVNSPVSLNGTIKSFICRHPTSRKKFISTKEESKGKKAITHYKVLKKHPSGVSWLECQLETGRTHQIRVHLASIACSLLGDKVYGQKPKATSLGKMGKDLGRVALHAHSLSFIHPLSKKEMNFESPWPFDLKKVLNHLDF